MCILLRAGPVTLYLQSVIVSAPTAPAVISAYLILKRSLSHLSSFYFTIYPVEPHGKPVAPLTNKSINV
jgi:hypothetical protein